MTSLIYSFVCYDFFMDCQNGKIVMTYVIHLLGTYVNILCNWLMF